MTTTPQAALLSDDEINSIWSDGPPGSVLTPWGIAKIRAIEQAVIAKLQATQEPMFWVRLRSDGGYEGPIHNDAIEKVRKMSGAWRPLYLHALQPAQEAKCLTCNGHGLIGGHMQDGSGYGEPCPDCNAPEPVQAGELPPLPHDGWPARFRCDSCDGNGEIGELISMGNFQPPERQRCPDCGGRGWSDEGPAFNADHMRDYARAALSARKPLTSLKPLTPKQVDELIAHKHFDPKYIRKDSDEVVLSWYRLGVSQGVEEFCRINGIGLEVKHG